VLSVFGVRPARIGGTEVFARELSLRLAERGWESILCFNEEPQGDVRRFLELPNVTFEVLNDAWKFHWKPAAALAGILRKHRPHILHLYFTGFLSPYPWVARLTGVKQVFFTDQGSQPEGYVPARRPLWKRWAARALNLPLDGVVCISDYNAHGMKVRDLIAPSRIRRIYNSVDFSAVAGDGARFRRRYGIPAGARTVLQVSWMIPEKGIPDLIQAARLILDRISHAHFILAGEGAHRQEYMDLAAGLGMESHFTWTGLVHNPLAEGLYGAADVVCQVSRWEEAFGWVIAEAMACARPLVATRVGGIPELVIDGETGYLVPPRSPAVIADKVVALLESESLRTQMGEAGRKLARARFDLQTNLAELFKLYRI
jgi:glycosyltransferase involved in cell wall biosynthesis